MKKRSEYLPILITLVLILTFTALWWIRKEKVIVNETGIRVSSHDSEIYVGWGDLDREKYSSISVYMYDDGAHSFTGEFTDEEEGISFTEGEHGHMYNVMVFGQKKLRLPLLSSEDKLFDAERMYLDYNLLPKLPTMFIDTEDGSDPFFEYTSAPKDSWGTSIKNNEYLPAAYQLVDGGDIKHSGRTSVKVRGNASNVTYNGKVSYRLKLNERINLLNSSATPYKSWALLSVGHYINNFIGAEITELAGVEFRMDMCFVNVIMNGDWKGCYCLLPAVSRSNFPDLVGPEGYIFENDAYWWNANDIYFRLNSTIDQMGYTFKYPDMTAPDDPRLLRMQNYMQEFEDLLLAKDERYRDYIDEESFARWLLVRDIMGEADAAGANTFYYKYDFDENDPTSSRLKMGPVWDFDNMGANHESWEDTRFKGINYFTELWDQPTFREKYKQLWEDISPELIPEMEDALNRLEADYGNALEESWELDRARWRIDIPTFNEQKEKALDWFYLRKEWMDQEVAR